MTARRRVLSPEEWELWAHVARQATPLPGRRLPEPPPSPAPPDTAGTEREIAGPPAGAPHAGSRPALKPLAPLERRMRQRLARGQLPVDGVLDLHGLRQDEAHRALFAFIHMRQRQGASLVLVVTGKGGAAAAAPGSAERGVLRRLVPHWLADPGLRGAVTGFETAARGHGGEGALYVRLRRAPATG
jgi:DNA-nicking Smr family endonuclease